MTDREMHGKKHITCPERQAFLAHRFRAKKRGIEFHFSYEEWVRWWKQHLGGDWLKLRGRQANQYVMARYKDRGPYALYNVKCITAGQNIEEGLKYNGARRRKAKLTKAQVKTIYQEIKNNMEYKRDPKGRVSKGTISKLADKYNVTDQTINSIQRKLTWADVTDLLD